MSVVVSLIHDAQEIAILTGQEVLDLETLNQAYKQRLSLLHGYIQPTVIHNGQSSTPKKKTTAASMINESDEKNSNQKSIADLVLQAKTENLDIVSLLKEYFVIVEVAV